MSKNSLLQRYLTKTPQEKQSSAAIAYLAAIDTLEKASPTIAQAICKELQDQRSSLKLIASENYSSLAVQLAMGNLLTDKYAEGYAHHRFYAGCENVDTVEEEANQQALKLFKCEHSYVQPHCGADANLLAFWAVLIQRVQNKEVEALSKKSIDELTPADYEKVRQLLLNQKLMGMSLNSGGHLTHGYRHNISSKMFQAVAYEVDPKTNLIDYQVLAKQVQKEKPLILLAGYSAYPRRLNFAKFREIADSVSATLIVDMAHFAGLVAGKAFKGEFDPIPYAHIVTSTTHKTLRGPRGGLVLCKKEFADAINKGCPLVMGGPLPHVIAAKAIAFQEANTPEFQQYAQNVVENAAALADALSAKGVRVITGGTENHLLLFDVSPFGITGRQAELALREAHLTANRNAIPYDPNGPWYTSGVRMGTAALTTLGMGKEEMKEIASLIVDVMQHTVPLPDSKGGMSKAKSETKPAVLERVRTRVKELLTQFPLYPELEINPQMG